MSYLKIKDNNIVEAPYFIEKDGKFIYGYNKDNNQQMLFDDGYNKYQYQASRYTIKDGNITLRENQPLPERSVYSKLEIRRAMRKIGIEHQLNEILSSDFQFSNDWNDAQEIDLNDSMIKDAINYGYISQQTIDIIKGIIQNEDTI